MRSKLITSLFFTFLLSAGYSQNVIHYWHFNGPNIQANVQIVNLPPDSTLLPGAFMRYEKQPGASAAYTGGAFDGAPAEGSIENNRFGTIAGNAVRPRNPSDSMQFLIYLPTTGYEQIVFSYAAARTNQGAQQQLVDYSLDSGVTYTSAGLSTTVLTPQPSPLFTTYSFNFSSIPVVNNNSKFVFRVRFAVNASGGSGNNRFDNMVMEGQALGAGILPPQISQVSPTDSLRAQVTFNKNMRRSSVETISNYSFTPSRTITQATYDSLTKTVQLQLAVATPLVNGQPYTLTVNNVIAADSSVLSTPFVSPVLLYNAYAGNDLLISEIMYNPGSALPSDSLEFIEVYNRGSSPLPIGGLRFSDGISGTFPAITLAPGGLVLFAFDTALTRTFYGSGLTFYPFQGALSNGGEIITLRNFHQRVLDSVNYDDAAPWPTTPDGTGPSLELIDATADNNIPQNWRASVTNTGKVVGANTVFASPGIYLPPSSREIGFATLVLSGAEANSSIGIGFNMTGTSTDTSKVLVQLFTIYGTATQGQDFNFSPITINIPPGSSTIAPINLNLLADNTPEADEYLVLRLTSVSNAIVPPSNSLATVYIIDNDKLAPTATGEISLSLVSSFRNKVAGQNSAEIVSYDSATRRLFIANSIGSEINIVDFNSPSNPVAFATVNMQPYGGINSIAVQNGIVAAAVEHPQPDSAGSVVFFSTAGVFLKQVRVGVLPDMLTFTKNNRYVITANEGQPTAGYTSDPEGSVSIIDISGGLPNLTQAQVRTVSFAFLNPLIDTLRNRNVRIFGPGATVAKDLEPEYIATSDDSRFAYAACQENNAFIGIDLDSARVVGQLQGNPQVISFGLKDHSIFGNELDASDQGGQIRMSNWPRLKGLYQPDALASFRVNGKTYLVGANEGDAREGVTEETDINSILLDSALFPSAQVLRNNQNLGRLVLSNGSGDLDKDGDYDELHVFGARSISIWDTAGVLIWDSRDQMERIVRDHPVFGPIFNANQTGQALKNRSDNKGPEPEGVVVERIGNDWYAFVALERIGGCMVWKVTNPLNPVFVNYANNRSIPYQSATNDAGAEGIIYISPAQSPDGFAYILLANEVSSSISAFRLSGGPLGLTPQFDSQNERALEIFPNPSTGLVQFSKPFTGVLFDALGRQVASMSDQKIADFSNLPSGLYLFVSEQHVKYRWVKE
jgi:hypothetical protein